VSRICQICTMLVPPGRNTCPTCGASSQNFSAAFLEFTAGTALCRVREFPFLMTRDWVSRHFRTLEDGEGNPIYRYFYPDLPMVRVLPGDSGYRFLSDVPGDDQHNHARLDGQPLDHRGVILGPRGGQLEIWARRNRTAVCRFDIRFIA